jgi:hypothetical protein
MAMQRIRRNICNQASLCSMVKMGDNHVSHAMVPHLLRCSPQYQHCRCEFAIARRLTVFAGHVINKIATSESTMGSVASSCKDVVNGLFFCVDAQAEIGRLRWGAYIPETVW